MKTIRLFSNDATKSIKGESIIKARPSMITGLNSISRPVIYFGLAVVSVVSVPVAAYGGVYVQRADEQHAASYAIHVSKNESQQTIRGAENFIDNMASRALRFLKDDSLEHAQKLQKFKNLLSESFDINTLARFALGRYWRTANQAQRESYIHLFKKMVVEVYAKRFGDYQGQRFVIQNARMVSDTDIIVTSQVLPPKGQDGQTIKIAWRVRYKDNAYQIVDVIVEGVSMSLTKRSDFSSVIQRGGGDVAVLLQHLRQKYAAASNNGEDMKAVKSSRKTDQKTDQKTAPQGE